MAVLLELAAKLGLNVHVGVIAGALLWTSVWFARTEGLALQTWRTSLVRVRRPSAVLMHPDVERPCKGVADKVSGCMARWALVYGEA